ncbi:MAG: outer membrane lipoprotein carrier protein LolA [Candidatus Aminicenantes bacterium]|nr:outer membrane lipoprotein carrier protein LolA [Candidatus Aminicenantes bacterium]
MKPAVFVAALIGLLAAPSTVPTADEVALRLEGRLRALQSLEARFRQVYAGQPPAVPIRETGRFYFQKPDRMRWRYEDPEPKDYLYRDGVFSSYFPEDNQMLVQILSGDEPEAAFLLILAGARSLRDDYDLELDSAEAARSAGSWTLRLKPKAGGEADDAREILLEVDGKDWLIRRALFKDWAGNASEFAFEGWKTDRRLDPGLFELKVPDDCEIIRQDGLVPPDRQTDSAEVRIPQ